MMLTIKETAIVMTVIEGKLVTPRQVYYRLNKFDVLGTRLGRTIRICIGEIEGYYDRTKSRTRSREVTGAIDGKAGRSFFSGESKNDLQIDFKQAITSVERWERQKFERKQKSTDNVYTKKRNFRQLIFEFAV